MPFEGYTRGPNGNQIIVAYAVERGDEKLSLEIIRGSRDPGVIYQEGSGQAINGEGQTPVGALIEGRTTFDFDPKLAHLLHCKNFMDMRKALGQRTPKVFWQDPREIKGLVAKL